MSNKKQKLIIFTAIVILAGFWFVQKALAGYYTSGNLISTNLLSGKTVISINSFVYNLSAKPAGTGAMVGFNQESIVILNTESHPQAGDNWTVSFETKGTADLDIIPEDEATANDLDFISLKCLPSDLSAEALAKADVIFYPNWSCQGTGQVTHLVNVTGKHTLKFQFGDKAAYAYNNPESVTDDTTGIFKEFFATFVPPPVDSAIKEDKDSLGLRVYTNLNHLPLRDWYQADPAEVPGAPVAKGAPVPMKVGPYEAMQEGRTYYINGVNLSGSNLYSNVYVFSFSDNPTAETLNIVNQLLANFALNVNISDKEETAAIYRDFKRIQDFQLITNKLWDYYRGNQSYPKLTENPELGTYLPSYTNSKWRSWQGVLGNLLGYTLPVDPQNGFYGCGSSTLSIGGKNLGDFDSGTCWNAASSTFACPAGSQVYQYETKGGASSILKAKFERPAYTWVESLDSTKPVDLAGTLTYQTDDTCNDTVHGIGGRCGDGIIGTDEVCEIGQTMTKECWTNDNYSGLEFYSCNSTCRGWTEGRLVCETIVDSVTGELGTPNAGNNVDLIIQKKTSAGADITITENGRWGIKDDARYDSREAAGSTYWVYESKFLDVQEEGDYGAYVKSGNANVDLTRLPFNNDGCPVPGIQHRFVFYLDDRMVGEVCNPAVGSPQSVTSWVALGNLQAGKHNLKVSWVNDWVSDTKVNGQWEYDSNVEIYKVGIGRNCHEDTLGIGAICIPQGKCGDGAVQTPPEQCDDGKNNGKYGYCNTTCTGRHSEYCGNAKPDVGKEVCDKTSGPFLVNAPGTTYDGYYIKGWCEKSPANACYIGYQPQPNKCYTAGISASSYGASVSNDRCVGWRYTRAKDTSCSWDCQSYDYCGDGRVNGALNYTGKPFEVCEESASCRVGICNAASDALKINKYCEENTDCGSGVGAECVDKQSGKKYCNVPGEKKYVKFSDSTGQPYFQDATSTSPLVYPDTGKTCDWDKTDVATDKFASVTISCLPWKAPTPVYSPTNCGNGIIDVGEVCDAGALNGVVCAPVGQAQTCTYCAYGCQQVMTVSK